MNSIEKCLVALFSMLLILLFMCVYNTEKISELHGRVDELETLVLEQSEQIREYWVDVQINNAILEDAKNKW